MRAFRGATTVEADDPTMIRVAVRDLMNEMLDVNELVDDDLVDVILTVTPDLTSMYAGKALREECGFSDVPLLGAVEADVAAGIDRCIRIMLHAYSPKPRSEIRPIYHGETKQLRPDLHPS